MYTLSIREVWRQFNNISRRNVENHYHLKMCTFWREMLYSVLLFANFCAQVSQQITDTLTSAHAPTMLALRSWTIYFLFLPKREPSKALAPAADGPPLPIGGNAGNSSMSRSIRPTTVV